MSFSARSFILSFTLAGETTSSAAVVYTSKVGQVGFQRGIILVAASLFDTDAPRSQRIESVLVVSGKADGRKGVAQGIVIEGPVSWDAINLSLSTLHLKIKRSALDKYEFQDSSHHSGLITKALYVAKQAAAYIGTSR
jgi:hypothetical protein